MTSPSARITNKHSYLTLFNNFFASNVPFLPCDNSLNAPTHLLKIPSLLVTDLFFHNSNSTMDMWVMGLTALHDFSWWQQRKYRRRQNLQHGTYPFLLKTSPKIVANFSIDKNNDNDTMDTLAMDSTVMWALLRVTAEEAKGGDFTHSNYQVFS